MAKMVTLLKAVDDNVKTPQIKVILKTLEANAGVDTPYPYLDLIKAVDANADFVSRQGASKVVRFYEKPMIENGLIAVEGTDKPEALGKPAKKILKEPAAAGEHVDHAERKASRRKKGEHAEAGAEAA